MRHFIRTAVLIALTAGLPLGAAANEPQPIRGQALYDLFSGETAISEYRTFDGIEDFMFSELHKNDGTTEYIETGSGIVRGKWTITKDDKICYQYPGISVMDGMHCFSVYLRDNGCYYNYGYRVMTTSGPRDWGQWTSRFVRKGHGGSCAPPVS